MFGIGLATKGICLPLADGHAQGVSRACTVGAGALGSDPLSGHLFVCHRGERAERCWCGRQRVLGMWEAAGEGVDFRWPWRQRRSAVCGAEP